MKNGIRKYRGSRSDRCTSTLLSIGVLLLCALMLGIGTFRDNRLGAELSTRQIGGGSDDTQPDKHVRLGWYIRSGQWRADIRSLVAAIQYLSEPGAIAQTNGPASKADNV